MRTYRNITRVPTLNYVKQAGLLRSNCCMGYLAVLSCDRIAPSDRLDRRRNGLRPFPRNLSTVLKVAYTNIPRIY